MFSNIFSWNTWLCIFLLYFINKILLTILINPLSNFRKVCFDFSWQKQSQGIIIVLKHSLNSEYLQIIFFNIMIWVRFPFSIWLYLFLKNLFCLFIISWFKTITIWFAGYHILRTDKGQPRPKYIFNKCGTNIYFINSMRFGSSLTPNFKLICSGRQRDQDNEDDFCI